MALRSPFGETVTVTRANRVETLYITGDEYTDGSMRIVRDADEPWNAEFEYRDNGAWNKTGLETGGPLPVQIGELLGITSIGHHLTTIDQAEGHRHIIPHIEFNGGMSAEAAIFPVVHPDVTRSILQPDDSGVMSGSTISWTTTLVHSNRFIMKIYLNIETAPTDLVELHIRDTNGSGPELYELTLAPESLPVGEVELTIDQWINEEDIGSVTWFEFICASGTISLKSNIGGTVPWYAYDYRLEEHQSLAPLDYISDSFVTDPDTFELLLTTDGNVINTKPTGEL